MSGERRRGGSRRKYILLGLFVFLTAPLLLLAQSKYKGRPYYSKKSPQVLRHYLQMTLDVYCDRVRLGGEYPEYSVLLICEFLARGNKLSAETWLRYGVLECRNPALADLYAKLVTRGVLSVPHPQSFARFLRAEAERFRHDDAKH